MARDFHSHFDDAMTQFIINKRTDAEETDVNLFRRREQVWANQK